MLNPTASIYRKVKSSYKNNNVSDFYDSWLFDVEFYGRWAGLSGSPFYHSGRGLLTECEKFLTLFDYHSERMWDIFVFRGAVIPNEYEESPAIVSLNAVEGSYISSLGRRFFTPRCSVQNDMSFRARPVGRRGISFLSDYHSERMWEIFVFRGAVIPNEHEESQSIVLSNAVGGSYIEFSWQEILYFMLFCSERQNEKEKTFGNDISWNDSTFCEA